MKEIGNLTFISTPTSQITEEGDGIALAVSGESPAPSVEAPKESEIRGVASFLKASRSIGQVGKPARVWEEVLTAEVALDEERVPGFIELVLVPEEPLFCPTDVNKDAIMIEIGVASRPETLVFDLVASSFHPSPGRNQSEWESTPASDPVASPSHQK
ncbi:hypothetical protein Nepgr_005411 [Nepenthes gracilis]|uniref:Uncharacterized protein n=1 Tax=Nepenthes gracilis TaxID=150966 RepID=A0AAD3S3K3_NEPGR|nr:hypothetical protein Nepgr_005411 [Nepenthes gracilis]